MTAALAASASAPGTEAARSAHRAFSRTVLQVISAARRHPTPTAATAVLHANRAGELTNAEMAGMLGMLLIGTIDSLATVIPAGTLLAMRCPDVGRGLSQRLGGGLGERPHHESVRGTGQTRALTEEILRLNPLFSTPVGDSPGSPAVSRASPCPRAPWSSPPCSPPTSTRRSGPPPCGPIHAVGHPAAIFHSDTDRTTASARRSDANSSMTPWSASSMRLPRLSLAAPADELTWHGSCLRRVNRLPVETHASALTG